MEQDQQLIRAAGGLLWKYAGGEWRLAVVRLRRRGDEWTLPKGKLKENESFLEAAKREVSEETGCKVDVRAFRSTLWYPSNGVQKIVLLWDMRLIKEGKFEANDEIDAVDWWAPSRAREKLIHAREREVIPDGPELSVEPITLPDRGAGGRLAQSISCFAIELEASIKAARERGDDPWIWASTAREHLHLATQALACDLEEGWLHFHASQRWALHGLSDAELSVKERALIEEANHELDDWPKQLVLRSLEPNSASIQARRAAIFEAAKARDEYRQDRDQKQRTARGQIALLGAIVFIAVGAIVLFSALGRELPVAVLFGALGAALSAMPDLTGRVPAMAAQRSMTLARVAVGGAAGLVVHTAIRADGRLEPCRLHPRLRRRILRTSGAALAAETNMNLPLKEIIDLYDPDAPLERASTIPAEWYVDGRIAELERRTVFSWSWQIVGRADQVEAAGQYLTAEVAGERIVVVRGNDHVLRAFFNVCRHHAAAVMTEPEGHAHVLRCPYHAWTYSLEGELKGTPDFAGACNFERKANGLVPVEVAIWGR